jgi:hypothetical protein
MPQATPRYAHHSPPPGHLLSHAQALVAGYHDWPFPLLNTASGADPAGTSPRPPRPTIQGHLFQNRSVATTRLAPPDASSAQPSDHLREETTLHSMLATNPVLAKFRSRQTFRPHRCGWLRRLPLGEPSDPTDAAALATGRAYADSWAVHRVEWPKLCPHLGGSVSSACAQCR